MAVDPSLDVDYENNCEVSDTTLHSFWKSASKTIWLRVDRYSPRRNQTSRIYEEHYGYPALICETPGCTLLVKKCKKCIHCVARLCNYIGCIQFQCDSGSFCITHRKQCGYRSVDFKCTQWAIAAHQYQSPSTYRCEQHPYRYPKHDESRAYRSYTLPTPRKSIAPFARNHIRNDDHSQLRKRYKIEEHIRKILARTSTTTCTPAPACNRGKRSALSKYNCSEDVLRRSIASKMKPGMTLENLGSTWKVVSLMDPKMYDLFDKDQVNECYDYRKLICIFRHGQG